MTNLRVDTDALRRSEKTLGEIGQTLGDATGGLGSIRGATVAQDDLRARLEELGGSWGVGLKKLGEYATGAATALAGMAGTFETADSQLADVMTSSGEAPGSGSAQNGPVAV